MKSVFDKVRDYIKNHKKVSIAVTVASLAVAYGVYRSFNSVNSTAALSVAQAQVVKGPIEVTVTGTGTILPVGSENIGASVSGTVKKIYVQNGDKVKKGDLLAEVVNDALSLQVANARLELEKATLDKNDITAQLSYDMITAPFTGRITSMDIKAGDEVSKGSVLAVVQDDTQLVFDMPIDAATAQKVAVGQKVEVFLPDQGETVEGQVVFKSGTGSDGQSRAYLKVAVAAGGNRNSGTKAFGTVTVNGKEVDALSVSTLDWRNYTQLKATLSGKISGLYVQEGQAVKKGQNLFALSSDTAKKQQNTLEIAYNQAQLNLADMETQLQDLMVKAPIDGAISGMEVKEGDEIKNGTVGSGSSVSNGASSSSASYSSSYGSNNSSSSGAGGSSASSGSFGRVINNNQMKVTFPVDEVEIAKVKVGQKANISVDALPEEMFEGTVTEIAEEGVVTNNVSSFNVTILIENPKSQLKSGMTANVTIIVAKKGNAVLIPIEALQERGQRKFVLLPTGESANASGESPGQQRNMVSVEVGLTNESYAEITKGLKEGDQVLIPGQAAGSERNGMIPGLGGGRIGGGSNRSPGGGSSGGGAPGGGAGQRN